MAGEARDEAAMTLRQKIVRRWTRMLMPWRYDFENVIRCWCGGTLGLSRDARVGECQECGTGVLLRRLTEKSYERWYRTSDYRRWVMGTSDVSLGQLVKEMRRAQAAYAFLEKHGYGVGGKSVLDIGSGAGGSLVVGRLLGAGRVRGVDTDSRSVSVPSGFGISVSDHLPSEGAWDLVICSHLIEHITHPLGFLAMLYLYTAPTGCIYVETPAWGPKAEVKLPHPFMYSERSFRLLVARADLKIVAMTDGIQAALRRIP